MQKLLEHGADPDILNSHNEGIFRSFGTLADFFRCIALCRSSSACRFDSIIIEVLYKFTSERSGRFVEPNVFIVFGVLFILFSKPFYKSEVAISGKLRRPVEFHSREFSP